MASAQTAPFIIPFERPLRQNLPQEACSLRYGSAKSLFQNTDTYMVMIVATEEEYDG